MDGAYKIILCEVSQSQKNTHGMYVLTDNWTLAKKKLRILMIQLTDHMKLKKKKDQCVDASILHRKGNKIIMGGRGRNGPGMETVGCREEGDSIRYV